MPQVVQQWDGYEGQSQNVANDSKDPNFLTELTNDTVQLLH